MFTKKVVLPGTKEGLTDIDTYLKSLILFHQWRQKIVGMKVSAMNPEVLNREIPGSFGSMFIILKHLIWAEKVWLSRVKAHTSAAMAENVGDISNLVEEWNNSTSDWVSLVESSNDLNEKIVYFNTKGQEFSNSLDEVIIHLVDHSTYHIGQLMNSIRSFDLEPVSTNYIHYLRSIRIKE